MAHKTSYLFLKKKVLVTAVALAGMTSWMACTQFDLAKPEIQANPEFGVAIGKFSFLFSDFLKNKGDSLLKVGVDSSIALKFAKDSIAGYSVADIVNRATGGVGGNMAPKTIRLGSIPIADLPPMNQSVMLRDFASAFPPPVSIWFATGGTTPPSPAPPVPADSALCNVRNALTDLNDFQDITLSSGNIAIRITNNFPFALNNLKIDLLDRSSGTDTLITTVIIGNIAAGGNTTGTADLSNKKFSNKLATRIAPRLSYGSIPPGTVISSTSTLDVQVTTSNFKVKRGNAIIPARSLAGDTILASMATGNVDQKLTEITIKSATLTFTRSQTTPIQVGLNLGFATMIQGGNPVNITLPAGANSASVTLNNAVLYLDRNAAQPFNQLPIAVSVNVVSSAGVYKAIDEDHTITVQGALTNLQIGGAKGQFGNFDIAIPATNQDFGADFGYLSPESMKLIFANPSLKIKTLNSFGLTVNADLAMSATGFLQGGPINLVRTPGGGNLGFTIARPTHAQIATPAQLVNGAFSVDSSNSNLKNFMSILPKKISASGNVSIRSMGIVPGPAANWDYFTADSRIKLGLEMDIPIKFSAESLIIRDTIKTFAGKLPKDQVQYVDTVLLDIQYKTRLPLGIKVDLATLVNGVVTTVVRDISLPAADAIDANGRVTDPKTGAFPVPMTGTQLGQLSDAPQVVIIAKVQTARGGFTPVAMYTHYDFDMGIGLRIKTKIIK